MEFQAKFLLILIILSLLSCNSQRTYSYKPFIDDSELYIFSWKVIDEYNIQITMNCRTTGWVGFGLSKFGGMKYSELIIAYISEDGTTKVFNKYVTEFNLSLSDFKKESNIGVISGTKKQGRIKISIILPMNLSSDQDLQVTKGKLMNLIFAYNDWNIELSVHTDAARHKLILWPDSSDQEVDLESKQLSYKLDHTNLKMRLSLNNFDVPIDKKTSYACRMFKVQEAIAKVTGLPEGTSYHAVAFEPILEGNHIFIHHIILLTCGRNVEFIEGNFDNCNMIKGCAESIAFGGLGTEPVVYPDEAGLIWGSQDTEFVALQVHFEIPNFNSTFYKRDFDSSGFYVYFSDRLKKQDVGFARIGVPLNMITIPPKTVDYKVNDYCTCLGKSLKEGNEIIVFAYFMHGHKLLSKVLIEIQHSDGTPNTIFDIPQSIVFLEEVIKIREGDVIFTSCHYDSSNSTKNVYGGLYDDNEMCTGMLFYYPNGLVPKICDSIHTNCEVLNPFDRIESVAVLDRNSMSFNNELF